MKTHRLAILLGLTFAAGWFGGRKTAAPAGGESSTAQAQASTPPRPMDRRTASASDHEPSRKHWAEKIGNFSSIDVGSLMLEIPRKDRGAAIEAWLKSSGSIIGAAEKQKLASLMDAWVEEDPDSALEWSANLSNPVIRELAMTSAAASLAGSDPHRAFEHLISHGEFREIIRDQRLFSMMTRLSREAIAQNPAALAELWKRLPNSGPSVLERYGLDLNLPAGTDFAAVIAALQTLENPSATPNQPPMYVSGVAREWFVQDPEGATSYLIDKIKAKERIRTTWMDMYWQKKGEEGTAAAVQWTCDLIKDLPDDARENFLLSADLFDSPDRLKAFLQDGGPSEWISGMLQYYTENDQSFRVGDILKPLSQAQQIEYLKALRGPEAEKAASSAMSEWKFTESQQAEVLQAIKGD